VISVVEARVVRLLRGHSREMVELAAVPAAPRLLLSLSRDGNLRLWDVPSEACLASLQTDATTIVSAAWCCGDAFWM
jgi:WD40 repeat protein